MLLRLFNLLKYIYELTVGYALHRSLTEMVA